MYDVIIIVAAGRADRCCICHTEAPRTLILAKIGAAKPTSHDGPGAEGHEVIKGAEVVDRFSARSVLDFVRHPPR